MAVEASTERMRLAYRALFPQTGAGGRDQKTYGHALQKYELPKHISRGIAAYLIYSLRPLRPNGTSCSLQPEDNLTHPPGWRIPHQAQQVFCLQRVVGNALRTVYDQHIEQLRKECLIDG